MTGLAVSAHTINVALSIAKMAAKARPQPRSSPRVPEPSLAFLILHARAAPKAGFSRARE